MVNIKEPQCYAQRYLKHRIASKNGATSSGTNDGWPAEGGRPVIRGIVIETAPTVKLLEYLRKAFPCGKLVIDGFGMTGGTYKKFWDFHHKIVNEEFTYMLAQDTTVNGGTSTRRLTAYAMIPHPMCCSPGDMQVRNGRSHVWRATYRCT